MRNNFSRLLMFVLAVPLCLSQLSADNLNTLSKAQVLNWAQREIMAEVAAGNATAAAATIVYGGEVLLAEHYGEFDPIKRVPIEAYHQFMIGSVSKTISGLAIAQLLDQGLIGSLDDPANRHMSRYQIPGAWGDQITIGHLLTHTSGMASPGFGSAVGDQDQIPATPEYIKQKIPPIVRQPGKRCVYSNQGLALVGIIVEDVTGQRYDDYLKANILQPLGMDDSAFEYDPTGGATLVRAGVIDADNPNEPMVYAPITINDPVIAPAGSLQVSARDMGRYMNGMLGHVPDVITPSMIDRQRTLLFENHRATNQLGTGVSGMAIFRDLWNGTELWSHGGLLSGFRSKLLMVPEIDLGIFVVFAGGTSHFYGRGGDPNKAIDQLLSEVLGVFESLPPIEPVTDAQEIAGRYWGELRAHTTPEVIFALPRVSEVTPGSGGGILMNGTRFVEVGPGLFQSEMKDGRPPRLIGFDDNHLYYHRVAATKVSGISDPEMVKTIGVVLVATVMTGILQLAGRSRWRWAAVLSALAAAVFFFALLLPVVREIDLSIPIIRGEVWRFQASNFAGWILVCVAPVSMVAGLILFLKSSNWRARLAALHQVLIGFAAIGLVGVLRFVHVI